MTEKIIEEYKKHKAESNSPWFNLSVSMQNHGGYWESTLDKNKKVDVDDSAFTETSRGSIEDLATGLHYADLALGELIDYFKTVDEPTVIVMFGDHMSNAGQIGDTLLDQSSLLLKVIMTFQVLERLLMILMPLIFMSKDEFLLWLGVIMKM